MNGQVPLQEGSRVDLSVKMLCSSPWRLGNARVCIAFPIILEM